MYVIIDLDKSLANAAHREHFVKAEPKNWDAYYSPEQVIKDAPMEGTKEAVARLLNQRHTVVILTERGEPMRDVTTRWLFDTYALDIPERHLLMRTGGNMLTSAEYKREQVSQFVLSLEGKNPGILVIESDSAAWDSMANFGVVLKAPECWGALFPQARPAEL